MKINKKNIEIFKNNYFVKKEGKSISKIIHKINLINEGFLDSLDMVTFSLAIEKKFKIKINPNLNQTINNFKTLKLIINLIYNKLKII